ncbi:hypothetical protein TevJSym_an00420 [endosymbiont of Tevnia jerichonana (vent Tica)]|jgi:hypothetical protein|uniref:Uncharacterized protein n=1 Tax=endosymbiont of Tevnia jerichonana (vent Tica) TaxID=1049564 RepID=G2FFT3_9GAMM|nr:hypothetical protein TevJSym_an00420 [endosymbiont of Tevnia jerichonana (vent Tica)]
MSIGVFISILYRTYKGFFFAQTFLLGQNSSPFVRGWHLQARF